MTQGTLRRVALLLVAAAALWVTPAIVGPEIASSLARRHTAEVRFEAPRPAWPLGIAARRVEIETRGFTLPLEGVRLTLGPEGLLGRASLSGGKLKLRLGWTEPRVLQAEGIPVGELAQPMSERLALKGRLDGAARWTSEQRSANVWITDGSIRFGAEEGFEVPFTLLVVDGFEEWASPGRWIIRGLQLNAPLLSLEISGTVLHGGAVEARLRIRRMGGRVRRALAAQGLPTTPLPLELRVYGSFFDPHLEPISD